MSKAETGVVGLGRLTLSRRERMVMVEPRGTGMALFTLHAANEVRASQFGSAESDLDAEMVAIAGLGRALGLLISQCASPRTSSARWPRAPGLHGSPR